MSLLPLKVQMTIVAYLHWEVWVLLVILENISDTLVNHGE